MNHALQMQTSFFLFAEKYVMHTEKNHRRRNLRDFMNWSRQINQNACKNEISENYQLFSHNFKQTWIYLHFRLIDELKSSFTYLINSNQAERCRNDLNNYKNQ